MKRIFIILSLLLLQQALFAQQTRQQRIDSLAKLVTTATHDTVKIKAWNRMSLELSRSNRTDTALQLLNQSLELSKKHNFKRGEADATYFMGQAYYNKGKANEAVGYYEKAIKLYQQLPNRKTEESEAYYGIAMVYQRSDYEKSFQYAKHALTVAQQTNLDELKGKQAYLVAVVAMRKADYDQAAQYTDLAINYYTKSGYELGIADGYVASSRINKYKGNYQQALKDNYAALRSYDKVNWNPGRYNVHTGLGTIYEEQKNYKEALNSYLLALKAAKDLGSKELMSGAYNNTGNMYLNLDQPDAALSDFKEGLKLAEAMGEKKIMGTSKGNIGTVYNRKKKYEEALKYFREADQIFQEVGAKESIARGYIFMADAHMGLKNYNESKTLLDKAIKIGKESGLKETLSLAYEALYQVESASGDYASAFNQYKNYINYRDSISNAEVSNQLVEQRMQYAFSKKEDSLKLQQALIAEQLEKQTILSKQQQQELELKQAALELTKREKDVQMLTFLKKQAELQLINTQNEKELSLAEQEKALQAARLEKEKLLTKQKQQALEIKDNQLYAQRSERNLYIAGIIGLLVLSFFVVLNNRQKNKANKELQQQKGETEKALKELKATQAQLIQREKMASLGELTAGIAHEIQNPLNFVNNFSGLNRELASEMKEEILNGNYEEAKSLARTIEENGEKIVNHGMRAAAIIKSMLEHSRTNAESKELTDINTLAEEYLQLAYHGMRAKEQDFNTDIKTDYSLEIGKMKVVPQDLGRVLLNLYSNAFYAVNEKKKNWDGQFKPQVTISTKRRHGRIEIRVRDNGMGIPEQTKEKIFQPFFTTKPTGEGTGLGLSLSYDIVNKGYGGEIIVDTKEGEYTEFIVRLPDSLQPVSF